MHTSSKLSKRPLYEINRRLAICLALSLAAAAALAGCSTSTSNPAQADTVTSDPAVGRILVTSCYGCHTGEGTSEWYAKLEPSQWFNGHALEELNFSQWQNYGVRRRKDAIREIAAAVQAGTMPPSGYTLFYPGARLNEEQKQTIAQWAARETALPAH